MIIITGASKGIGNFLFSKFKENGEMVIGTYNSTIQKNEIYSDSFYKVDVSNYKEVSEWVQTIQINLHDIVLINCAGISYNSMAHKADIDIWKKVIDVNLVGTFNVIHELLPFMRVQGFGRIINLSSVLAKLPTAGVSAYSASKAGLIGLTKSLAVENAKKGITINCINLGYSAIGMGINEVPLDISEKLMSIIPIGRFCYPEEIFKTIEFLIGTDYITGTDIDLNGGII